jgi:hypothetical protein
MQILSQSVFVLGLAALSAVPALAQPQPGGPGLAPGAAVPVADPGLDLVIAAGLVADKSLQEDLKLTVDQVKDIAAAVRKIREKYQPKLSTLDPKVRSELLAKFDDETRKAAAEVLKPEQAKRLKQIERQMAGVVYAFLDEEVAKEMKLTDEQKGKIKGIITDLQKEITKLARENLGEKVYFGGLDNLKKIVAYQKAAQTLQTAARDNIVDEVLTADQRKAWKELIGEPFEPTSR